MRLFIVPLKLMLYVFYTNKMNYESLCVVVEKRILYVAIPVTIKNPLSVNNNETQVKPLLEL